VIRLHTFGTVRATSDEVETLGAAAGQRRLLGLLAVLSTSRDKGLSRESLVGLLWPDSEPERARHSLTQSLYLARRAFGCDELFLSSGADIRLNPACLSSDVEEFQAALEIGDLARAVDVYEGPFLDGFALSGSPDFEHWTDLHRARFESDVVSALESLAEREEGAGNPSGAVERRRRACAIRPLDAGLVTRLMHSLVLVGDRAGALQQARIHENLLRQQLDLDPDPVVAALAERLKQPVTWSATASVPPNPARDGQRTSDADDREDAHTRAAGAVGTLTQADIVTSPVIHDVTRWTQPRRRQRRVTFAAVALVMFSVVGVLLVGRLRNVRSTDVSSAVQQRVVVAPFRASGADPSLQYLRDGLVELLSTRLADDTAARSVDAGAVLAVWKSAGLSNGRGTSRDTIISLARRLGAERAIVGNVVGQPRNVVLSAEVIDVATGVVSPQVVVEGPVDSITTLVDRLAGGLLASAAGEEDRLSSLTTASLPALRAYLSGQAAFRSSSYASAVRNYDRALRLDSTFALAALQLAVAAQRIGDIEQARVALDAAWGQRAGLSERDRTSLLAILGPSYPAPSPAAQQRSAWERIPAMAPNRGDSWFQFGELLMHEGRRIGARNGSERAVAALKQALALLPDHGDARELLLHHAARTGDTAIMRVYGSSPALADSLGLLAPFVRWRVALVRNDSVTLRRTRESLFQLGPLNLRKIVRATIFDGLDPALSTEALQQAAARPARTSDRVRVLLLEHAVALNQGQVREALELTGQLGELQPGSQVAQRLRVLDWIYAAGDSAAAAAAAEVLAQATRPGANSTAQDSALALANLCVSAQWKLAHSDTTGIAQAIQILRTSTANGSRAGLASPAPQACGILLDAATAVALDRSDAGARMEQVDSLVFTVAVAGDVSAYAHLWIARLHAALGSADRALAAVTRRSYMLGSSRYLAASLEAETDYALSIGDTVRAERAFAHLMHLRTNPDPGLRETLEELRAKVHMPAGG
jgi:DNA-binding SARP family transcriptional activator/tetratricopeptide (TPR) repeat protein/TolB-like protein